MPELPEVETVVRELRGPLIGKRIIKVHTSKHSLRKPWRRNWNQTLSGRLIRTIQRRGKWIILELDTEFSLVVHLGMTGQLTVPVKKNPVQSHTHLRFVLDDDVHELRFRDVRRFGSATLLRNKNELNAFFAKIGLGPEPFQVERRYWENRLANTRRCLKAVLLDQTILAGVGNIYADESLYLAGLHPARLASEVSPLEGGKLRKAIERVLNHAIKRRGSSIRDYVGGSGRRGSFQEEFQVYGQTGKPCPTCRTPIMRAQLAGRSSHFCPVCQPESPSKRIVATA